MKHLFRKKSSCQIAKDRLRILLISDRVNCSTEVMEHIKTDLARVISKYMKIDENNMEVQINTKTTKIGKQGRTCLYANIPIMDFLVSEFHND